ncbi:MAG: ComEC family competence protein [Bacteroidales bacterium]|nr:ComEC family competence protein [Bacteroidales bacterium]
MLQNFINEIKKIPLFRLILPFIAGIIIQIHSNFLFDYFPVIIFTLLLFLFILYNIEYIRSSYYHNWIFGFIIFLVLFLSGIELVNLQSEKKLNSDNLQKDGLIIGIVNEEPKEKEKSVKTTINVTHIKSKNQWIKTEGKTLAYFQKDSLSKELKIGDQIIFNALLDEVQNSGNPKEFDYKKYLAFHLISKQTYIKSNNWKLLKKEQGNFILLKANSIREKLMSIYENSGIKGSELGVLSALTLGYKNKLDEQTKRAYSSSGGMHVLAVSGLHVGIIFVVLNSLFFFFNRYKYGKFLKSTLIIFLLLAYAILTGLSPSVLRATIMFCFVIIGTSMKKQTNIYNTLAAAAFFMLLINPYLITEVGFQLSYLAVIGIVYFQPKIYSLFYTKNWLFDKIWSLTSVSIAAQITTFPISLYYFHQFPNYFLLTNMIVIPFATLLIYIAGSLFLFSYFEAITQIIGKILTFLIKTLNNSVIFIEQLPHSIASNISITLPETILIYIAITIFTIYIIKKQTKYLKYGLITLIVLLISNTYKEYISVSQKKVIIYNIPKISAYNFITGKKNIFISDIEKQDTSATKRIKYVTQNAWLDMGLDEEKFIHLNEFGDNQNIVNQTNKELKNIYVKNNFINFEGVRFLIPDNTFSNIKNTDNKINLDYLILNRNCNMSIDNITKLFDTKMIIFDSSISGWKKEVLINNCKNQNIPYYSVSDEGAFQIDI